MRHPTLSASGDIDWKKIRVLLFSTDDSFRFLVRQTFRKLNVREVLSTSIAADAAQMMEQSPDIALIDPSDDLETAAGFLQKIRQIDPDMPVLATASSTDKAVLAKLTPLGIEGIVPKRVSGHELSHRTSETLLAPKRLAVQIARVQSSLDMPLDKIIPAHAPVAAASVASVPASPPVARPQPIAAAPKIFTPPAGKTIAAQAQAGRPAGGRFDDDELAQAAQKKSREYDLLEAEDQEAKRRAAKRKQAWLDELSKSGRKPKKGKDVAALDVSAVIAAHALWLTSKGADGERAVFQKMDLGGADLSEAVLANATFRETDLSDAFMSESRLDGADFRYAILEAAQMSGCNLGVAQLRHADLRMADLQGAVLRGADLSGAKLRGAKLDKADFGGAVMISCDLSETDLSKVENLTQAQMDKTFCDMSTRLPPGLRRPVKTE